MKNTHKDLNEKVIEIKSSNSKYKLKSHNFEISTGIIADINSDILLCNSNTEWSKLYLENTIIFYDTFIKDIVVQNNYNVNNFNRISTNLEEYLFTKKRFNFINTTDSVNSFNSVISDISSHINLETDYYKNYYLINDKNTKEQIESDIWVNTGVIDSLKEIVAVSYLIEYKNNYLWTKLFHGYLTKDLTINIDTKTEIQSIINFIKNIPRNLNGFTLKVKISESDGNNTLKFYEFNNGNIIIQLLNNSTRNSIRF